MIKTQRTILSCFMLSVSSTFPLVGQSDTSNSQAGIYQKVVERPLEPFSASTLDPLSYGVVLDHAGMKEVIVTTDVSYLKDDRGTLKLDIYSASGLNSTQLQPAVIFLNAIGENGERKVKSWGIYSSWPRLIAAHGYVGISMEADGSRIQQSVEALFDFIDKQGHLHGIDKNRLAVYAASANVSGAFNYLQSDRVNPNIKAAVLYYGAVPPGPYRKDLPVYFVVAEGDVRRSGYGTLWTEVLRNNAPWTIKMATGMPHAFDAYSDTDQARIIVKETISFWQNHLDLVPQPTFPYSAGREIFGSSNPDRQLAILKEMAEEHPEDIAVLSLYGNILRQNNHVDKAERTYEQLLKLDPAHQQATLNLASIAYAKDQPFKAGEYIKRLEAGNVNRNIWIQLGYNLLVLDRNKEAADFYERALSMGVRNYDYYNLACAYAKQGDARKAVDALQNGLRLGYGTKEQIENDPDFDLIRSDKQFVELMHSL